MDGLLILDDGTQIDRLEFDLPDGFVAERMNREELADAMGVSTNTITKWIGEGMPVAQHGGNGKSYEFDTGDCTIWRMWRDGQNRSRKARIAEAQAQMQSLFRGLDDHDDEAQHRLTAKDIKDLSDAEYARNKVSEQKGDLVRAHLVEAMVQQILITARHAWVGLPDFAEAEFGLTPIQVERMAEYADDALREMKAALRQIATARGEVQPLHRGDQVEADL